MTYQFAPILVVAFAIALGMTPVSRQVAMRLGVIDRPKKRNITKAPTPMLGGLAIFTAYSVSLFLFLPSELYGTWAYIWVGTALLGITGAIDDRYDLSWRVKMPMMMLSAVLMLFAGININLFQTPLIDFPITIIWLVALINAVNFMDNMDGLSAGLSAIAGGFFVLLGLAQNIPLVTCMGAGILGSALGFLTFNFNPASTFMGDMGALALGYNLGILGILIEFDTRPIGITWMIPILVLALPIFDINLVVFTRLREGRSPVDAGKDHTSHRLLSAGFSARMTLFILYSTCLLFGSLAILISTYPNLTAWLIGVGSLFLLLILFILMMYIRWHFQLSKN
ncbi:MAG: undecaprenyl/decaprenyl-phosphate alpha-N-acetylglucosaminyl 1-phosphate transferase [Anaerolineae bacterium]|jgi:UDP-GlcNAc:undecaprenyl-phosphate GlcNAc-1-phosphate transferase|nr:undecaprenyl/decaprenyl-phosphate alpha-N-acetylglucosaminyl 1-phosphate transferase [Anaerolineae bacterium]